MDIFKNDPAIWRDRLPVHKPDGHKYDRGIAVIYGAPKMTGATRLAARACSRIGAGLVKVIAPDGTGDIYRTALSPGIVVEDVSDFQGFDDARIKVALIGPGFRAEDVDLSAVSSARHTTFVLDAGAIAAWNGKGSPDRIVMTPHDGEFTTKFGKPELRLDAAQRAAKDAGATIVLKGPETTIVGSNDTIIQNRAVPELATAGTGDVLAGMITGFIAQGMETVWASAAAVWIHAEAASRFGRGLTASDLPEMIPQILREL